MPERQARLFHLANTSDPQKSLRPPPITNKFQHSLAHHLMKIFFIRHGETEHNVAQLLAGITNSRLTQHGVLQTHRLGAHLIKTHNHRFTHIFASNLQRAYMTAQAVADAQAQKYPECSKLDVVRLAALREQDFGSDELVPWNSKRGQDSFFDRNAGATDDPNYRPKEPVPVMKSRAAGFVDNFLIPLFATDADEESTVAVVSHGLFLGVLWRDLLSRFGRVSVSVSPNAVGNNFGANFNPLEHIGIWANTGYLEVEIQARVRSTPNGVANLLNSDESQSSSARSHNHVLHDHFMIIKTINGHEHIKDMKKIRGGVANVAHEPKQKDIAGFFKKPAASDERDTQNAVESGEVLERALDAEIEAEADKAAEPSPMGGVLQR